MSKALQKKSTVTIVAMLVVAVLAIAFWVLLLGPKRDEAAKLGEQVETAEASLAQHRAEVTSAEAARKRFPVNYQKLVVLGAAVPGGDETASLIVQVNGIARHTHVLFKDLQLEASSGGGSESEAAPASSSGAPVSATEAAASLLPLGATIGPAGLAVMPYTLTFEGSFFQIADFIKGLDSLVKTQNEKVRVDGRLITIGGFTLTSGEDKSEKAAASAKLTATFQVTTYLTPPGEGVTAGASPASPAEASATPASTTTGGAP